MKPKPTGCTHLQLTLPRIERGEARARIAAKIATRQIRGDREVEKSREAFHKIGRLT